MRFLTTFAAVVAAQAAVQLTANTSSVSHLDRVLVTATGLTPGAAYWMGIFYPANASVVGRAPMPYPATAPWTENAPAEYVDVNAKADGTANFTWTVVNALSDDLQVWIFSGSAGDSTVTALAGTGPIKQIDGTYCLSAQRIPGVVGRESYVTACAAALSSHACPARCCPLSLAHANCTY